MAIRKIGESYIIIPHLKRIPTERGFTTEWDTPTKHRISLEIDMAAIWNELGAKAVKNKSGRSSALHGLIRAREVR